MDPFRDGQRGELCRAGGRAEGQLEEHRGSVVVAALGGQTGGTGGDVPIPLGGENEGAVVSGGAHPGETR
jgi:hypothetical protein